ncbi:IS110 family transposase [Streptomyces syringium]|uniref:IS110 family transposase n=1 Tax=Streptomyces syringium TaxID=76729 RepID=UPI003447E2B9
MTVTITPDVELDAVFGGVDSHADTIHFAVITDRGGHVADAEFPTTAAGYAAAIAFLNAHGTVTAVGVEGTSSYGLGFTRAARQTGLTVIEVNRPDKAERRRIGKSDPIDAYAAARAALSGRASVVPKDDTVSGIRALHNAARSAVKARTATLNQIAHILITAPDNIRVKYTALRGKTQVDALSRLRPTGDGPRVALLTALKTLARRVQALTAEHDTLTAALDAAATEHNPGLRAAFGVGPDTAAQLLVTAGGNPDRLCTEASFAALCGVVPVPASSGRTNRHRLSRGGDRGANAALYRIALVRMSSDARTRDYVARQTAAGRTKKEIIRLLQARDRPGNLPLPHHAGHRPGRLRPPASTPGQEHHPDHRRRALRRLAGRDLLHRTRHTPRRRPRRRLPRLANRRMTSATRQLLDPET